MHFWRETAHLFKLRQQAALNMRSRYFPGTRGCWITTKVSSLRFCSMPTLSQGGVCKGDSWSRITLCLKPFSGSQDPQRKSKLLLHPSPPVLIFTPPIILLPTHLRHDHVKGPRMARLHKRQARSTDNPHAHLWSPWRSLPSASSLSRNTVSLCFRVLGNEHSTAPRFRSLSCKWSAVMETSFSGPMANSWECESDGLCSVPLSLGVGHMGNTGYESRLPFLRWKCLACYQMKTQRTLSDFRPLIAVHPFFPITLRCLQIDLGFCLWC